MVITPRNINFDESNGRMKIKISPVTGEALCTYWEPSESEIHAGIDRLRASFEASERKGIVERAELLFKLAEIISNKCELYAHLTHLETGKPISMCRAEAMTASQFMKSLAGASHFYNGDLIPSKNREKLVMNERTPYGLAGLIVSFNTPLPNFAWKFAPSWLAGNLSILKPSEHNPLTSTQFVEDCLEAGFPKESVSLILGGKKSGQALVKQKIDLLSFTGSYQAAIEIQNVTSNTIRKNIFELGGTNPIVVFADANLNLAAKAIAQSAFSNSGQRCAAGSILIAHNEIKSELIDLVKAEIKDFKIGFNEDVELGSVIDENAVNRYRTLMVKYSDLGLKVTSHGMLESENRFLLRPTLVDIGDTTELLKDEYFLPVLRLTGFSSVEEALSKVNSLEYGLTAAVWTNSMQLINEFRKRIRAGVLNINGPTHGSEFQFPFGGIKKSGNGSKDAGLHSLEEYSFRRIFSMDLGIY